MVRLKARRRRSRCTLLEKFQFHNGSIKRCNRGGCTTYSISFNSTMVRLKDCYQTRHECPGSCFNSTMVRLKALIAQLAKANIESFNSTMVRLKVGYEPIVSRYFDVFQFHNGSIKSLLTQGALTSAHTFQFHNGSIKRFQSTISDAAGESFQFHNGSIKSVFNCNPDIRIQCFNSTMVRLKVDAIIESITNPQLFQFHNGSIKSHRAPRHKGVVGVVSIPQWFD